MYYVAVNDLKEHTVYGSFFEMYSKPLAPNIAWCLNHFVRQINSVAEMWMCWLKTRALGRIQGNRVANFVSYYHNKLGMNPDPKNINMSIKCEKNSDSYSTFSCETEERVHLLLTERKLLYKQ